ncbi:MAG: ribosome biogenesis GTP-binding protein YihA/YsxC [Paludibacteraceae bacterium]|nr:ribosome biogenesis GTP-binding protein YihA/YsxC [Paludibacteraceae bacterium]
MIINSAEFVISNVDYKKCPVSELPEYAFIGRSNVGKSSLINMLTGKKDLAKTSSKPGKTLLINHFIINEQWHLVDLPGYGYAKASKTMRDKLKGIIEGYVLFRQQLTNLFVLVDSRLAPQQIDLEFMEWLGEQEVPFSIVFTKGDKQSTSQLNANVMAYKKKLIETWETLPPIFVTSAEKGFGKDDILNYIESINAQIENV